MSIEERRDAMRNGVFHLTPTGMEEWDAQLTRVLALCKAAELSCSCDENTVLGVGYDAIQSALAEMRKHGDIPADGMTREGPI